MNISNFKTSFDTTIYNRGKSLFSSGALGEIRKIGEKKYVADIEGSEDEYYLECHVNVEGSISRAFCSCPYDWGPYCKHQAAFFLAIQKQFFPQIAAPKLQKKPIGAPNGMLPEKKMQARNVQAVINKAIRSASRHSYVPWNRGSDAFLGGEEMLEIISSYVQKENFGEAARLLALTIEALIIGLQDIDDSSGEYSGAISQECIIEAIPEIFSRADVRIYTEMVEYFLEIIERGKIQGFGYEDEICEALVPYFSHIMQVVRVEDFFIQEEVKWNLSSRHGLLIYKLYEQVLPEHERDFLEEIEAKYVQDEALLLFRVEQHKQEKDYTLAEAKLLRHLDISHNYYSPDYKVLLQLFELADIQNEAEKKKKYADLIFQKDTKLENYKRLKSVYDIQEISLEDIEKRYFGGRDMNHIHLIEIAFFENQLERACSYIEKYQSLHITEYFFKKLKTYNPKLLANIYIQAVQKELEHTSNRSNYKRCTKLLAKVYPFASELILQCVKNLLSQYPTRTALKEELYLKFGQLFKP